MNYSKSINYDLDEVARQMAYAYYRRRDDLPPMLYRRLNELLANIDPDYNGFSGDKFQPEYEIKALTEVFGKDENFKQECINFYQYSLAKEKLNIKGGRYELIDVTPPPRDAWTSVRTTYVFEARDGKMPKDLFRLVAAVKSVIGKRNFCKSYKKAILTRMFGEKKHTEKLTKKKDYIRLSKRRQWDKLLRQAKQRGLLTYIPAGRGYYFSIRYKEEKLRQEVTKAREKWNEKPEQLTLKKIQNQKQWL